MRTWAPKGCTPVIQFHFNWKHVSAIAGLTRTNFVFRLHDGAIKSAQIVEFLKALRAQLKRKLLIVWDGAAQHKSRIVREYLDGTRGAVQMALLPGYAPDLNPVEYLCMAQAARVGELLPQHPGRAQAHRTAQAQERPEAQIDHCRLLEQAELW